MSDHHPDPATAEHLAYLDRMFAGGVVPAACADAARTLFHQARFAAGDALPVPAASAFGGGPIHLTWDAGPLHLSAEVAPDGAVGWFGRDRGTGEVWGEDCLPGAGVPAGAVERLRRVAKGN